MKSSVDISQLSFDKSHFQLFTRFSDLDDGTLRDLRTFGASQVCDGNDIGQSIYPISIHNKLRDLFPVEYTQKLIQRPQGDGVQETDYTFSEYPNLVDKLRLQIPPFFRARLSFLPPHLELPWHVDTNTSVACRLVVGVEGVSVISFRKKKQVESVEIHPGMIYFINAAYPHRVQNLSNDTRVAFLCSCLPFELVKFFEEKNILSSLMID